MMARPPSWRALIVGAIAAFWITIGVAWGAWAAMTFGFFVLVACLVAVWSALAGGMSESVGRWYYDRQMGSGAKGRRHDRARRVRR
jgi:hypothetical protein